MAVLQLHRNFGPIQGIVMRCCQRALLAFVAHRPLCKLNLIQRRNGMRVNQWVACDGKGVREAKKDSWEGG